MQRSLGKGLGELFQTNIEPEESGEIVITAPIEKIYPDENQHRKTFHDESLRELADSIAIHGVLQPLLVRKYGAGYQIIAGERRYRASKLCGLTELPVIVKDFDEKKASEAALIENLQREDLNPIDEAAGFAALMRAYNLTQAEAARQIGKSRAAVANSLRLLNLPSSAQSLLKQGIISAGHARALLPLEDEDRINDMLIRIVEKEMSVREVEEAVKLELSGSALPEKKDKEENKSEVYLSQLKKTADMASAQLGRKVKIREGNGGKGKITLEYTGNSELEELLTLLCGEEFLLKL